MRSRKVPAPSTRGNYQLLQPREVHEPVAMTTTLLPCVIELPILAHVYVLAVIVPPANHSQHCNSQPSHYI